MMETASDGSHARVRLSASASHWHGTRPHQPHQPLRKPRARIDYSAEGRGPRAGAATGSVSGVHTGLTESHHSVGVYPQLETARFSTRDSLRCVPLRPFEKEQRACDPGRRKGSAPSHSLTSRGRRSFTEDRH